MRAPLPAGSGDIDVSVTVVSTNERHYLDSMLPQLCRSAKGVALEILLVDNASADGTAGLAREHPGLKVIRNDARLGFSANHNLAMRQSHGRYVLCLNPDVLFHEEAQTIGEMARFMDGHPECGVAGCKAYDAQNALQFPGRRFQTPRIVLARRAGKVFYSARVVDGYLYREHSPEETFEVDWLLGSFLFMRRAALMDVGLFDERYVKYFEDVDLCRRMACHGFKVMYYGGTHYFHIHQRASKRLLSRDAWLHLKSWMRWLGRQGYYRRLTGAHDRSIAAR